MVTEKWISEIIAINKANSRLMSVKLLVVKTIMVFHSAYAPQQGLAKEVKEEFYATLNRCLSAQHDENVLTFIGGDMNGHVGSDSGGYTAHGGYGYGTRNLEGNLILEFCTAQDMYLCNTYFKRKEEQLLTYSSGGSQSQIDFIITNHRCRKFVQNTKVIPGEAAFCQHRLVVSDLNIPVDLRPVKKPLQKSKLKVWKLKEPEVREKYQKEVSDAIKANPPQPDVNHLWNCLKTSLITATEKTCGVSKGGRKNSATWWWNSEVEEYIKEKRRAFKAHRRGK